ncbi:hypothetical protein [Leucobacter sp. wl10]|uniref:hypothetical protein n=1 Tax=Leucobacter sp. wl10 TaxID=2304677 RepID=UPI000E5B01F1|nr:hypothetical protein [Leucobacter sp. wl10]RGE16733.1 hypothetical protein D1J51_16535 [Leucobacter sp. wl10]
MRREGLLPARVGAVGARHGSPVGGAGGLGILLLEVPTAIAIVSFFWKDRRGFSLARVIIAPAISAVGLAVPIALAMSQMDLPTAAPGPVNAALLLPILIALVHGLLVALRLRRRLIGVST